MKVTVHEKTWKIYHDALSIMTSKATKQWMQDKGYLDRWILPSNDLYDNLPSKIRRFYEGKPIGNSPEFMPLDTQLNQDLHSSHDYHSTVTQHLEDDDPWKFNGSIPKQMSNYPTNNFSIQIRESLHPLIKFLKIFKESFIHLS